MTMIYIRKIISVLAIIQEGKWKGSHKQSYIDINGVLTALITFLFLIFLIHHFPPYRDSTATPEWLQITVFRIFFAIILKFWSDLAGGTGKDRGRWKELKKVILKKRFNCCQEKIFSDFANFLFHYSGKFECLLVQIAGGVFIQYSKVKFKLQNTFQLHWNDITFQLWNCLNGREISFRIELPNIYSIPMDI